MKITWTTTLYILALLFFLGIALQVSPIKAQDDMMDDNYAEPAMDHIDAPPVMDELPAPSADGYDEVPAASESGYEGESDDWEDNSLPTTPTDAIKDYNNAQEERMDELDSYEEDY